VASGNAFAADPAFREAGSRGAVVVRGRLQPGPALRLNMAPDATVLARIDRAAENARETQMRASARVGAV
jgi:hypothetical protein